ncbi:MAG: hypothetical protein VKI83_04525 [Synechococcaceae cyanobacterium]|nr:hypothetical protein [Synechococcaceae cyanobacterium]
MRIEGARSYPEATKDIVPTGLLRGRSARITVDHSTAEIADPVRRSHAD